MTGLKYQLPAFDGDGYLYASSFAALAVFLWTLAETPAEWHGIPTLRWASLGWWAFAAALYIHRNGLRSSPVRDVGSTPAEDPADQPMPGGDDLL